MEGYVKSLNVSRRRLYFLPKDEQIVRLTAGRLTSSAARKIARCVLHEPGLPVARAAAQAGLSRRVVYHHAAWMREVRLIEVRGEPHRLYPTPILARLMSGD